MKGILPQTAGDFNDVISIRQIYSKAGLGQGFQ
jgi:hypothetical protein